MSNFDFNKLAEELNYNMMNHIGNGCKDEDGVVSAPLDLASIL